MNLSIYVLLLSIWTSTCLNTNQSGGYSTTVSLTGTKNLQPTTLTKMDNFKKNLHVHIIGITCTAFVILSFCFLHYNCLNDDFPKAEAIKKCVADKLSKSSILSFTRYKRDDSSISERQPMLAAVDKLSEASDPETSSFNSKNAICSSSSENLSIPSSTGNSMKPSRPKRVSRKSDRKYSLSKSHKLAYARKGSSQIHSSFPNRAVRLPSSASLQSPLMPTETPYQTCPKNQILLLKSSTFQKHTKSSRYPNLKRSFSTGMLDMLSKSHVVNSRQYSRGKSFISESFVNDISEAKKRNVQSPPFPHKVKPFAKFFNKVDSPNNAFYGNASDSDKMICDNDANGERKITINSD